MRPVEVAAILPRVNRTIRACVITRARTRSVVTPATGNLQDLALLAGEHEEMGLLHNLSCRRCFGQAMVRSAIAVPLVAAFSRARAGEKHEAPVPGAPVSAHSQVLDLSADAIQAKRPVDAMSAFLNGFHFYADDMGRQVEANHFCTHLTEDFHQCVIYDSDRADAKLIGIEYIVSEKLFRSLPAEEKRLWHSHHYEVKSGELIAPGVPEAAGHILMNDLAGTYGKTWHTWQVDRSPSFPTGIPQLMMGFVKDGQVDRRMLQDRDRRFGASVPALREGRSDIPWPKVDPGANAWQGGRTVQLRLEEVAVRGLK